MAASKNDVSDAIFQSLLAFEKEFIKKFESYMEEVGGLGKVRVNCFPKATATWHGREPNPRPPDRESDALTTLPRCP
ncbi:hypothetical protein ElyMa_001963100 [Elysia marginata]|uniref:Uncharacterized protein n=1 Tax=Elysia marginata TaxID=1093978 RepID=A0AAV4F025_9GAST|nr:hypothetical protein ElyMa_001963100 [Elysia marginata]